MANIGHVRNPRAPCEAVVHAPLKPCLELLQLCGKARATDDRLLKGNTSPFGEPYSSLLLSVASDTLAGPAWCKDGPSQLNL